MLLAACVCERQVQIQLAELNNTSHSRTEQPSHEPTATQEPILQGAASGFDLGSEAGALHDTSHILSEPTAAAAQNLQDVASDLDCCSQEAAGRESSLRVAEATVKSGRQLTVEGAALSSPEVTESCICTGTTADAESAGAQVGCGQPLPHNSKNSSGCRGSSSDSSSVTSLPLEEDSNIEGAAAVEAAAAAAAAAPVAETVEAASDHGEVTCMSTTDWEERFPDRSCAAEHEVLSLTCSSQPCSDPKIDPGSCTSTVKHKTQHVSIMPGTQLPEQQQDTSSDIPTSEQYQAPASSVPHALETPTLSGLRAMQPDIPDSTATAEQTQSHVSDCSAAEELKGFYPVSNLSTTELCKPYVADTPTKQTPVPDLSAHASNTASPTHKCYNLVSDDRASSPTAEVQTSRWLSELASLVVGSQRMAAQASITDQVSAESLDRKGAMRDQIWAEDSDEVQDEVTVEDPEVAVLVGQHQQSFLSALTTERLLFQAPSFRNSTPSQLCEERKGEVEQVTTNLDAITPEKSVASKNPANKSTPESQSKAELICHDSAAASGPEPSLTTSSIHFAPRKRPSPPSTSPLNSNSPPRTSPPGGLGPTPPPTPSSPNSPPRASPLPAHLTIRDTAAGRYDVASQGENVLAMLSDNDTVLCVEQEKGGSPISSANLLGSMTPCITQDVSVRQALGAPDIKIESLCSSIQAVPSGSLSLIAMHPLPAHSFPHQQAMAAVVSCDPAASLMQDVGQAQAEQAPEGETTTTNLVAPSVNTLDQQPTDDACMPVVTPSFLEDVGLGVEEHSKDAVLFDSLQAVVTSRGGVSDPATALSVPGPVTSVQQDSELLTAEQENASPTAAGLPDQSLHILSELVGQNCGSGPGSDEGMSGAESSGSDHKVSATPQLVHGQSEAPAQAHSPQIQATATVPVSGGVHGEGDDMPSIHNTKVRLVAQGFSVCLLLGR